MGLLKQHRLIMSDCFDSFVPYAEPGRNDDSFVSLNQIAHRTRNAMLHMHEVVSPAMVYEARQAHGRLSMLAAEAC